MASPFDREAAGSDLPGTGTRNHRTTDASTTAAHGAVSSVADPAEIRAMAFAASLGPSRPPHSTGRDDLVIDLAGEEALVEFLMRITPVDVTD